MTQEAETSLVILLAERMMEHQSTSDPRTVMDWFEKAVQVTLKYEVELKPQDRRYIVMQLEATWGASPAFIPPKKLPSDRTDYVGWVMKHIMYLLHPDHDDYEGWADHAFAIMNECREYLGMPRLEPITSS